MSTSLDIEAFLEEAKNTVILDVRSPGEYNYGHIPGALNLPLFSDEERAEVGTLYKQVGQEDALLRGLELVGVKMADFVRQAREVAPNRRVLLYCWRGGMRSNSMSWLLSTAGFHTALLKGGYKTYRNFVLDSFRRKAQLIILGGMTGTGKTGILHEIARLGAQTIDLEALACHKGSAFGALGQQAQPTAEMFENSLLEVWQQLDLDQTVWVEDESHNIGQVPLPQPFWEQMKHSPVIDVQVPREFRVARLVKEYAGFDKQLLQEGIVRIQKRLGFDKAKEALQALKEDNFERVADLLLVYYDKSYRICLERRKEAMIYPLVLESDDAAANARAVIHFVENDINLPFFRAMI